MRSESCTFAFRVVAVTSLLSANVWSQSPESGQLDSTGSGFVVSTQGYLITNNHVTQACESVRVKLDGTVYAAQVIAFDQQNDLALLKLTAALTKALSFRDSPRVKLGETVIVIGYPLPGIVASSLNLTTGSVSALAGIGDDAGMLQLTAPVQPGNSGGPLLDQSGNVIGVVTSKLSPLWMARVVGELPENVNFAIKGSIIQAFLDSRGVHYQTKISHTRLETTDIGEAAGKAVGLVMCFGPTSSPAPLEEPKASGDRSAFDSGLNAYHRRDYATALKEWKSLAKEGNASAQSWLGHMYAQGQGVPQDYKEAMRWYRLAADQGYAYAQTNIGLMYDQGRGVLQDYKEAMRWYRLGADQGNAAAQFNLGIMYNQGHGVPQDYKEAAQLFRLAANQAHGGALFNLGYMYAQGRGVAQDYEEARLLYRMAADQGNTGAQTNLGFLYAQGHGVTQDYKEAARWFLMAANQGNAHGQVALGILYAQGRGVAQDYKEAMRWYRMAADQGNADAQTNLGLLYAQGKGVAQDYDEAMRWFRLAADQGAAIAQTNLGTMYSQGHGVTQDYNEALRWYRLAADQGAAIAQEKLGHLFYVGHGVPQDYEEAMHWYRMAADQGSAIAQFNLGNMYEQGHGVPQDYIQAYKWFDLAGRHDPMSIQLRDLVASKMAPEQIAEAQRLAREWKPKAAR
jgi:TPR repeat protein